MKVRSSPYKSDEIYVSLWDILKLLLFGRIEEGATILLMRKVRIK